MAYLVDSNILVRLRDLDSLERAVCEQVFRLACNRVCVCICARNR
jgi:hypothetical protein